MITYIYKVIADFIPGSLHRPADLGYSPELCLALRTFELPHCHADEQALFQQFDQADQNRKWREGIIKSCFNYLLLDPRLVSTLTTITQITGSSRVHYESQPSDGNSCARDRMNQLEPAFTFHRRCNERCRHYRIHVQTDNLCLVLE